MPFPDASGSQLTDAARAGRIGAAHISRQCREIFLPDQTFALLPQLVTIALVRIADYPHLYDFFFRRNLHTGR